MIATKKKPNLAGKLIHFRCILSGVTSLMGDRVTRSFIALQGYYMQYIGYLDDGKDSSVKVDVYFEFIIKEGIGLKEPK